MSEHPEPEETMEADLLETAWGIIANAGNGDWSKESPEWQEAAARWRDRYHEWLDAYLREASDSPENRDG